MFIVYRGWEMGDWRSGIGDRGSGMGNRAIEQSSGRGFNCALCIFHSPLTSSLSPLSSHLFPLTSFLSPLSSHLFPLTSSLSPLFRMKAHITTAVAMALAIARNGFSPCCGTPRVSRKLPEMYLL